MRVREKGHERGCSGLLDDPTVLRMGTLQSCPQCKVKFVVAFGPQAKTFVWQTLVPREEPVQVALALDSVQEGATTVYTIVLPGVPPSKNSFDGWPVTWKAGKKRTWMKRVQDACAQQLVPKDNARVGIAARLVFATRARRDPQNYAQCLWNWVPDALVQGGYLVDDNEGRVQIGKNWGIEMAVDLRKAPKAKIERTILTLAVQKAMPR